MTHLRAFLDNPPREGDAAQHVTHARATLAQLAAGEAPDPAQAPEPAAPENNELF
jgi:hypothetical protein